MRLQWSVRACQDQCRLQAHGASRQIECARDVLHWWSLALRQAAYAIDSEQHCLVVGYLVLAPGYHSDMMLPLDLPKYQVVLESTWPALGGQIEGQLEPAKAPTAGVEQDRSGADPSRLAQPTSGSATVPGRFQGCSSRTVLLAARNSSACSHVHCALMMSYSHAHSCCDQTVILKVQTLNVHEASKMDIQMKDPF